MPRAEPGRNRDPRHAVSQNGDPWRRLFARCFALALGCSTIACSRDPAVDATADRGSVVGETVPAGANASGPLAVPGADPAAVHGAEASANGEIAWREGDRFRDVTAETGIDSRFSSGREAGEYAIIESLGGGVASFDYDRDGKADLMFAGGGRLDRQIVSGAPCGLFRNLGDWRFREATDDAGVSADRYYNHGIHPADFDGDGFVDLAISGYGGVQLFRNQGDGTFVEAGHWVSDNRHPWSSSLAWADFDGDGHLDCYVTHYVDWSWDNHPKCPGPTGVPREVCAPREFAGVSDVIYFNDGAGGFRPRRESVGLVPGGKGLGVVAGDVNLDGHVDLYVGNDTTDNFLYLNRGDGSFRETAVLAGVSGDASGVNTGSMGVALQDLDGDGLPDIWVTNFERELFALYRNEDAGIFSHVSRSAGMAGIAGLYVGFGTVLADLDLNGDRDIVVANGHVSYHSPRSPFAQEPLLLINRGDGRFRQSDRGDYFRRAHTGRGLIHVDLDDDGSWDLVFTHLEEPAAVLRGTPPTHSRWATVRLVGRDSNRDAIGANVWIDTDRGPRRTMLNGGGSYLSHSDTRIRLVAPPVSDEPEPQASLSPVAPVVHIRWPSGLEQSVPFPPFESQSVWVEGERPLVIR